MSQQPFPYSTIEPEAKAPILKRLRQFARVLDKAIVIPGTQVGIGLDPIIGLLPGAGDFLGVLLSSYIVLEAAHLGAPRSTLGRMVFNIVIDALIGTVPLIGDFFDFAWTANTKNIKLLEEYLKFPRAKQQADRWFIAGVLILLLLVAIALVAIPVILVRMIMAIITGS
jgi:hypothetical protein